MKTIYLALCLLFVSGVVYGCSYEYSCDDDTHSETHTDEDGDHTHDAQDGYLDTDGNWIDRQWRGEEDVESESHQADQQLHRKSWTRR